MKILILGGTGFLGRHLVDAARARGHALTLFNRGRHAELFPGVERLRGDRNRGDLSALSGRRWDAAIDTSGYLPARVGAAATRLADSVGHYTFVSSLSVYSDGAPIPVDERAAVAQATPEDLARAAAIVPSADDPIIADAYGEMYGALKAGCEQAATEAMNGRAACIRAGLVVGPHDYTDRFTYWPARIARGGEVLAPGAPGRPLQLVDARDLAAWIVRLAEEGRTGTYNATGPADALTIGGVLRECCTAIAPDTRLTWVSDDLLFEASVTPWTELPLWVPAQYKKDAALNADCRKAIAAGLAFRPLQDTIGDTLAWDRARPPGQPRRAGLSPERERDLLGAWRARPASLSASGSWRAR